MEGVSGQGAFPGNGHRSATSTRKSTRRLGRRFRFGRRKFAAVAALTVAVGLPWALSGDAWLGVLVGGVTALLIGAVPVVTDARKLARRTGQTFRGALRTLVTRIRRGSSARPVVAGMASIPVRVGALEQAVASVVNQVDHLYVFLNGYDSVPEFLKSSKITVYRSQEHGDLQDNGKFFGLRRHRTGIFFALDDDILYPANYVTRLRAALEQVDYQGVVGVHGVFYPAAPASFLNRKIIKYTESNRFLRPVSLLGTGTIAFAIDRIGVDLEVFETPGMADVWLAKYAKEHRIPMFAVSRPENWLRDAELPADSPTIWSATRRDHSLVSKVIYEQRPWGLPDLLERTDRLAAKGRLPERWRDFRAFCRDLQRYGAGRAVAALPPSARIWDYLKFFLEPAEALAVAEAALAEQGYDSLLFRRAVIAGANHDTQRAAEILAGALQAAAAEERWESAVWLACRASRLYRYVGDVERATAVLARVQHVETLDRTEDLGRLRSEQANAAISARDYPAACEILRASARLIPPTPDYHFRLAYALAKADSIRAAAPSIADLFLAAEAKQQQLNLIRLLRGFRYRNESLSGLPAGDRLERACAEGAIDPLPVIHLYLALGDREGAGRLLEVVRPRIADRRADYLPWLDAAVAPEIDLVIGHVNKALAAGGFAELVLGSARDAVTPLARLGTAALPSDRADDVSVIMTAYNCAETIGYAIESILNQTVGPLELIIVDDGSTDGTSEVVSDYAARDQRVIHLSSGRNAGPYVCRNLALAKARGQFIAIQDCDDYAHPQRLAHQLDLLARRDAMACYTGHVRVADEGQIVPENHGELIGEGPMTLMIRRRVVDDLGYFMPVRSRGDVEHRERMIAYYGSHRVLLDDAVLLFARDSMTTNSRVFEEDVALAEQVRRLRVEARRRHQAAPGRREAMYVPATDLPGPEANVVVSTR